MKTRLLYGAMILMVLGMAVGCTLTEIQAQKIAEQAGEVAATAIMVAAPAVGMSAEAATGVASAIGLVVATLAGFIIKGVSKKEIARVADTVPKK